MTCLHNLSTTSSDEGGVGTFDEIWDTVSCKAIGMKGMVFKPICLINTDGFYDGFAVQMERAQKEGQCT